jgi:predicted Zn-dependent protease
VLGQVLAAKNASAAAQAEFASALRLDSSYGPAQLDWAMMLLDFGHKHEAMPLLEKAAASHIPAIANRAQSLIQQLDPR